MALCLIRSTTFKTISSNLCRNLRYPSLVEVKLFRLSYKPRISNLTVQQRSHYWWSGILGKQTETTLKNMDQIPNELVMIYRKDDMDRHLKWIYLSLFVMSGLLIALVMFKLDKESQGFSLLDEESLLKSGAVKTEGLILLFSFSFCYMLFYGCMKRIPVRIYKVPKKEKYIFICNAGIPFTTRKVYCKKGECVKVDPSSFPSFIPGENIYTVANKLNMFLFESGFKKPADLHVLLGHQEDYDDN